MACVLGELTDPGVKWRKTMGKLEREARRPGSSSRHCGFGPSAELSLETAAVKSLVPRALFCSHTGPGLRGPGIFSLCTRQSTERSLSPQVLSLLTSWFVSAKCQEKKDGEAGRGRQ